MAKKSKKKVCFDCGLKKNVEEFKPTAKGYTKSCKQCINIKNINKRKSQRYDNFYIYKFLGKNNEVLYVGKTTNIRDRISQHRRNIAMDCENIYSIEYAELKSDYHMNIYEIHYICKYKPTLNTEFASENVELFDLPEVKWQIYIFKEYIDELNADHLIRLGKSIDRNIMDKILYHLDEDEKFYSDLIYDYTTSKFVNRHMRSYFDIDVYGDWYDEDEVTEEYKGVEAFGVE